MVSDEKFFMPQTIHSYAIDGKCRLTTLAAILYAQDSAAAHYGSYGLSIPHLLQKKLTWVLTKQHFDFFEYPLWLDDIIVSTWAHEPKGLFCTRDFVVFYAKNGKKNSLSTAMQNRNKTVINDVIENTLPFIRATSLWMVLDVDSGKPVKPNAEVMGEMPYCEECASVDKFPKIILPNEWDIRIPINVTISEIDLNDHVNNIHYVRWILSSIPKSVYEKKMVSTLDTYFLAQAKLSDELLCRCTVVETSENENHCVHSIIRKKDELEVFRAKSCWKNEDSLSRLIKI